MVNIVGPVHDVPGPTSTNIFRFPPRRATDAPRRIIASKIHRNRQWWMPSVVITKVETRVSFSITMLLYVSRSQPGQKTHELHLFMTTSAVLPNHQAAREGHHLASTLEEEPNLMSAVELIFRLQTSSKCYYKSQN